MHTVQSHPQLVTVPVGGLTGFTVLRESTKAYQKGDFKKGSALLLMSTTILTAVVAANGNAAYTATVMPFLGGSGSEFLKHRRPDESSNPLHKKLFAAAQQYNPAAAIDVNVAVRLALLQGGFLELKGWADAARHVFFAAMSAGYVMPLEGPGKISEKNSAKQERFQVIFWSRLLLVATLGYEFFSSLANAASAGDAGQVNPYAGAWMALNGYALLQDFVSMRKVLQAGNKLGE